MDSNHTPVKTTATKIRKVPKPANATEPKTPIIKTPIVDMDEMDDMDGVDGVDSDEDEIIIEQGTVGEQTAKSPKKVPSVQEREQFAIYRLLKDLGKSDDDIVDILGIRASVPEQIRSRLALLNSDDFAHFKNWKKLKLKPPKVVKAAAARVAKAKRPKFILTDYDKKRIPDMEHGMLYYVAKNTLPPQPGPQVYRDNFERTFVGHWVDGMIQPV